MYYVVMSAKCFDDIYAPIKYFIGFDLTDNKINDERNFSFYFIEL